MPGTGLLLHPLPGPPAHLPAFRAPAVLNGPLCAPQELARKSPDGNAGQRCLLWIQAQLGAGPISQEAGLCCAAGLCRIWERAGTWMKGRNILPATPPPQHRRVITRAVGMAAPRSRSRAFSPTLSATLPPDVTLLMLIPGTVVKWSLFMHQALCQGFYPIELNLLNNPLRYVIPSPHFTGKETKVGGVKPLTRWF